MNVSDIPDELQDQFYDRQNHSSARDLFQKMALSQTVAEPGGGRRGYSPPPPPIGMSTKMQNKTNTALLALLRLFYALEWIKIVI